MNINISTVFCAVGITLAALSYVWHPLLGVGVIFIGVSRLIHQPSSLS